MENNEIIQNFAKSRNLKNTTKKQYNLYIKEYCNYFQMDLQTLLDEAEQEEEQGIRWKHRKLKQKLTEFRTYLYNKHSKETAKQRMIKIKAFYVHYDIEVHKLPPFNERNVQAKRLVTATDLLTKQELRQVIDASKNPVIKPLILFMVSSGCARTETLNLTMNSYIKATENYHEGGTIKEIIETLNQKDNVVPTFNILRQKTNKYYITFCSPEAVTAINNYLLGRQDKLTLQSPLFKIHKDSITNMLIKLNDDLGLGYVGNYRKLRTHMLRKFNASALMNDGMSRELVNDLQGRTRPATDDAYFFIDEYSLKEEYVKHLKAVTIMEEVRKVTVRSKEFKVLEEENVKLKSDLDELKKDIRSIKDMFNNV